MPNRTTGLHSFSLEPATQAPTAVISPSTQDRVIGAIIKLDGRSSLSPSGEDLTYIWSLVETPLGSTATEIVSIDPNDAVVTFVPDLTGRYTIGLVVTAGTRQSKLATATVDITALLAPYTLRTTPDGSIMFRVLSGFWRLVENREVFATVWSGYMQAVATDLLRLFQVDYAKSISTIQPLFQRRWISYEPRLDLDAAQCTGVYGNHQQGSSAFTASGASASVGAIVSSTEVVLLDGTPTLDATGSSLRVFTSAGTSNPGTYTVSRLNPDESGYEVSRATPFPAPEDEVLSADTDMVTLSGDVEVYVADVSVNFMSLGVSAGDVLRIESGADAGYYRISKVGTADGLTNDRTLELEAAPTVSGSGRSYTIFKALRIYAIRTAMPLTDRVFIPESEADLSLLSSSTLIGRGTISGTFELKVERRHVFEALIGGRIRITSGLDGGRSFTITGLNDSGTGYFLGSAVLTRTLPAEATYEIPAVSDISDRVLILNGSAHEILAAELDPVGVPEADGGFGPVWAVALASASAPSSQSGLTWRVAATLRTDEFEDMEEQGVVAGDLLVIDVVRGDNQFVGQIPCYVLGAVSNKVAFVAGAAEPEEGADGELSNSEILSLAQGLNIPRVYEDPEDEDEIFITLAAQEIQNLLNSRGFQSNYYNVLLSSSTRVDLGGYAVRLRPSHIIRNCRIPVDKSLSSVPSLFEYIDEPVYGQGEDGLLLVGKDGSTRSLSVGPLELIENRDYSLSSEGNLSGTNLTTTENSSEMTIPMGDLIDRDVRVGDVLNIRSGFDQGLFVIQAVLDSEIVRAVKEDGSKPTTSATGLTFTISRRVSGNFLRFVDGMFTADSPAPARLWAQTSLYDNSDYIEDNFGVLVNITKDQLDEYGTSQVSYRGAVAALMFAWSNGPTLNNVAVGCHILTGLPVTEVDGRIIQVDDDYDMDRGRVLIEDLDPEGNGTGLVRVYFYSPSDKDSNLSEFAGLATNPNTGDEYAIGDVVPAFSRLSKAAVINDYISRPTWWQAGGATGADELEKFHTWEVLLDSQEVDSKDVPLILEFCQAIRPIYTSPKVVLVLYLFDSVEVEDELDLEVTLRLYDDPLLSLEETHMVDSYNESSLVQRITDFGSFSTRTLFEGTDLVTADGSGVVTSARGGFVGTLDATPLSHAPSEAIGTLPGVNTQFEGDVYYRGTLLVRVGDVLFIREGVNRGRYSIDAVTNTTLTISSLPGWPPRTRDAADIEAASGQVFQIQRLVTAEICDGTTATVEAYDAGTNTTVIEDANASFRWDGAAVGDVLVVETGADYGVHEILQVGEWSGGDVINHDTKLTISGELTEAGSFTYTVRREKIRTNPLLTVADGATTSGSDEITSATGGFVLQNLEYGDLLIPSSGTDEDAVFTIVDVLDDNTILVDRAFSATESSVEFILARPPLFEFDGLRDTDWEVEQLLAYDDVSLVIVEPLTAVLSLADFAMTAGASTVTSATDMQAAGVTAGMKLEIDNTFGNSGMYTVDSAVTTMVTIEEKWLETDSAVSGTFYESASNWDVLNDTVTLTSPTLNLEFGVATSTSTPEPSTTFTNGSPTVTGVGTTYESTVEVGDIVRLSGDGDLAWAVVASVDSNLQLTLDRNYAGTGGTGDLEIGVLGGLVQPGDTFEADTLGTFVIKAISGAELTLTQDTGVSPSASYTGRITRRA